MKNIETQELKNLEKFLLVEILGQTEACKLITKAMLRGELGYMDPQRPRSFLLVLGETGVGKTETALSIARILYGSDEAVIRLDMAEFSDKQTGLARMVGGPGEQGLVAEEMDRVDALMKKSPGPRRGRILLLDEIEKAHQDVSKLFLGLEAARLRMSNGRILDFTDTHIICTSNLGSESAKELSESDAVPYSTIVRVVSEEARGFFSSPVFARFTEVIVYRSLKYEIQKVICQQKLNRKIASIEKKFGAPIRIADGVIEYLVKRGFHKSLGARMMRNAVERELGDAFVAWELEQGRTGQPLRLGVGHSCLDVTLDAGIEKENAA